MNLISACIEESTAVLEAAATDASVEMLEEPVQCVVQEITEPEGGQAAVCDTLGSVACVCWAWLSFSSFGFLGVPRSTMGRFMSSSSSLLLSGGGVCVGENMWPLSLVCSLDERAREHLRLLRVSGKRVERDAHEIESVSETTK